MNRRDLFGVTGATLVSLTGIWPITVSGQTQRTPRLGVLLFSSQDRSIIKPCLDELKARGYEDAKTINIHYRDAEGAYDRLPALASELVDLRPDVLFAYSGELAPILKRSTTVIPIVVVVSNDPVESRVVASLARPGGNITGLTFIYDQLAGKTIDLLKEAVPSVQRVAILWNPNHADPEFRETERAARMLQVHIQSLEVRQVEDFEAAFQAAVQQNAEALIVIGSRIMALHRQQIAEFVRANNLILVGNPRWLTEIGALFSYGPDVAGLMRRAANYVEKILRGAKPADLPMQQPTTFDLIVNLNTAKALKLSLPQSLLARADQVIE